MRGDEGDAGGVRGAKGTDADGAAATDAGGAALTGVRGAAVTGARGAAVTGAGGAGATGAGGAGGDGRWGCEGHGRGWCGSRRFRRRGNELERSAGGRAEFSEILAAGEHQRILGRQGRPRERIRPPVTRLS